MNKFVQWFNDLNPVISIVGFVLGIISFVLSIIFYYKSKKQKKLSYAMSGFSLLTGQAKKYEKLSFLYNDIPIKNLTAVKLVLWNSGNETIDKNDVVYKDPFIITAKEGESIYDIEVITASNTSNNVSIEAIETGKKYQINFDYLDERDGFLISILHSGRGTSGVVFHGKVKGVKRIQRVANFNNEQLKDKKMLGSKWLYRNIRLVMYIILLVGTIIMIAVTNSLYLIFLLIIFGLNIFIESSKKHLPEELHNAFVTGN